MANETYMTVIGNLTADPELRFTPSGQAVANFTVASTPRHLDKQTNEWVDEEALFMRCTVWRQEAENVAESLTRGMRVMAYGRVKQRSYETTAGEKRSVIEMQCDEVGACVKFATVKVDRKTSGGRQAGPAGADDPWASSPSGEPAASFTDEPPF